MQRHPLDTHSYDGKINSKLLPRLATAEALSLEVKKQKGLELLALVKFNPVAQSFLQLCVTSMGTPANIDPTNGLIADDLIYLCWDYRNNPYFLTELEIQLMDMKTGACPQGRTHRLFQTLLAFEQNNVRPLDELKVESLLKAQ